MTTKSVTSKEASEGAADGFGYRAPQVCRLVGISYRQLDYWARTDLIKPSLHAAMDASRAEQSGASLNAR